MNRRTFARKVVGALFGVSSIPAFGQKPKLAIPPVKSGRQFVNINWNSASQLWIHA